jgi:RNA-binding protein
MNNNTSKKNQSHHLKPIVLIGDKGLTENVQKEIEKCLLAHELIKIRMNIKDKNERANITQKITDYHDADLIDQIGQVIVIFKEKPKN